VRPRYAHPCPFREPNTFWYNRGVSADHWQIGIRRVAKTTSYIEPVLIEDEPSFESMLDVLWREPAIGVDTEGNSLYRYHERVCLIQLSSRDRDYVVDSLAVDVRSLGELFASPRVEKVFHAGRYDVACLKRDYGFEFARLFDTMIASRLLGNKHLGLANVLRTHFGISLDKQHQRGDWSQRPLSVEQLCYAASDSHYLLKLRQVLQERLARRGRLQEARERFEALCRLEIEQKRFDPNGYLAIHEAEILDEEGLAVLRELYLWRENVAEALDTPPFRVVRSRLLVMMAALRPASRRALELVVGSKGGEVLERSDEVLAAIKRGTGASAPARGHR